jgi:hypothetical protein
MLQRRQNAPIRRYFSLDLQILLAHNLHAVRAYSHTLRMCESPKVGLLNMAYRKTLSLPNDSETKLKTAAKRRGLNANRVMEIALDLLDQVDHARADADLDRVDSAVVGLFVQRFGAQREERPLYFNK